MNTTKENYKLAWRFVRLQEWQEQHVKLSSAEKIAFGGIYWNTFGFIVGNAVQDQYTERENALITAQFLTDSLARRLWTFGAGSKAYHANYYRNEIPKFYRQTERQGFKQFDLFAQSIQADWL